jgi:hypothetical protein
MRYTGAPTRTNVQICIIPHDESGPFKRLPRVQIKSQGLLGAVQRFWCAITAR